MSAAKYPGVRITCNGNSLVAQTEARLVDAGIFYPITPSTEMGEMFQQSFADGKLNVFGRPKLAIECEGEHAAQGGAIAHSVTGKRVVNFTSGQGLVYGMEQYFHAPGKLSTMVVEVASRALTRHALNVHCGHDDIYSMLGVGWIMLMARDAQQAADQALIIRKVAELSLTPGINIQDGFLTSHLERTFYAPEAELIREFLGAPDDIIDCPTEAQRVLFGAQRRRVPEVIDLTKPLLLGPVQNQEHYMNGVIARRDGFYEAIPGLLEEAYREFGELTGRHYTALREYRTEDADTVFLTLGSAAENVEAAADYVARTGKGVFGSIHLNMIRPFPEAAIVEALRGKKNVIVLERTDEPMSTDGPIARDVRATLSKAVELHRIGAAGASMSPDEVPRIFGGSYGLGSRDFRPEGILGAYEYVQGKIARKDGRRAADGESFFVVGVDHPYDVCSEDTPSLLPDDAIAVRLHSIGGWGMITTGKNLGAIIGEIGDDLMVKKGRDDGAGHSKEVIHVSANPRYGSEKKGAPTAYFLVVADERIRVNCDLRHVDVVLCCDPKAFTHSNPLDGMAEGGAFVWESDETPEDAWTRIPMAMRQEIVDKKIKLFLLHGFRIAREAAHSPDLQLRMQGNAFLGSFFRVSSFLDDHGISRDNFRAVVLAQYEKKFGRFGPAVVEANMSIMDRGFDEIIEVPYGQVDASDRSSMRGERLLPMPSSEDEGDNGNGARDKAPIYRRDFFESEFRAGLGYHQPASPLASVGVVAAATGDGVSKHVARRETPIFIAANCTQCMKCITACPDTALPNTAQDIGTLLKTAVDNYVTDAEQRAILTDCLEDLEAGVRASLVAAVAAKEATPVADIVRQQLGGLRTVSDAAKAELMAVIELLPLAYANAKAIFSIKEKKEAGEGGLFSIFVSDLCKGCALCVTECGKHDALRMQTDSEELHGQVASATAFMDLLPETAPKYLGKYDGDAPQESRPANLQNHLMVRRNYQALASGDGACAGCGEKSILRSVASVTEAYMRPIFHARADRLDVSAAKLEAQGATLLSALRDKDRPSYDTFVQATAHLALGLGGEDEADTRARVAAQMPSDADVIEALVRRMKEDAFEHRDLRAVDGRGANGMSVMAMGASTGCNTVYGSTPPNNPHPYPWMNSLFQDGPTISWLIGESLVANHAQRSVVPERLCDLLLGGGRFGEDDYFRLLHLSDAEMTEREIHELPRVWCVGGDGALGDIGYQNLSKVMLQNRPNVSVLLLDTQVYSNTGGQNSDSSPLPGGADMNGWGAASQGKMTEKKSVAETWTAGHGSPFVAQVSMADQATLYKSLLDGLEYRGTSFYQCFTTCQPEHQVADDKSAVQATRIRNSRGMPQFVFDPRGGESYAEAMSLKGNPNPKLDWQKLSLKTPDGTKSYSYTVAHWAATERRFRRHLKGISAVEAGELLHLEDLLVCITQSDIVARNHLVDGHRAFIPDFGVYIEIERGGDLVPVALSRQLVCFCVERRKAWRLLQSKGGVDNPDYALQRAVLKKLDKGELEADEVRSRGREIMAAERG